MKIVKSFNFKRAKDKKEKKTNVECKDLCKSNKEFSFKNIQKYTREITMCLFAVGLIAIGYANYQLEETVSVASIDNFSNTAILENSNVSTSPLLDVVIGLLPLFLIRFSNT